jgi:hypothetical protein
MSINAINKVADSLINIWARPGIAVEFMPERRQIK